MTPRFRLLMLEDSATDAELMERELRGAKLRFDSCRVDNRADFAAALGGFAPDVILSDNSLPGFDALGALAMARERCPQAGFIVVSGTLGEELAIAMLQNGATDYVLKQRLARLAPVVTRAVREVGERRAARLAEAARREADERFQLAFSGAPIGMALLQPGGRIFEVNQALRDLLGMTGKALLSRSLSDLAHPDDRNLCERAVGRVSEGASRSHRWEQRLLHPDGSTVWVRLSLSVLANPSWERICILAQFEDTTAFKQAQSQLVQRVLHDDLTGLPNRALIKDRVGEALARAARTSSLVGVLFADLDRFKLVNDSLGHDAGDQLLVEVGHRLRDALRLGDTAGRLGGDEFVLVCEGLANPVEAVAIAERAAEVLARPLSIGGQDLRVSASFGIALADGPGPDPDSLIRDADVAMYGVKQRGGAGYEVFDEAMRERVVRRMHVEAGLRRALDEGELRVHYQPIVDLGAGNVTGFEALVRWQHPQRGLVGAAEFVPVAEPTPLIDRIGRFVLREACEQAKRWSQSRPGIGVAVNLSARQTSSAMVETVAEVLQETGLDPALLSLEVTESALIVARDAVAEDLLELRRFGVRIGLDDFGTGYSSLSYLTEFKPDLLKIDRSFVSRMGEDPQSAAVVTAVVNLAHSLGLTAVAEGVETTFQLEALRTLGCDQAQGFLFSPACPAEDATAMIAGLPPHLHRLGATTG